MKRVIFCFLVSFLFQICYAQKNNTSNSQFNLVRVGNWGSLTMKIGDATWSKIKDQIIHQVGEEKYQKIRSNYDYKSLPEQMSLFDGKKMRALDEFSKKLDNLKLMYKVATYDHISNGVNWGKRVILEVPYKGNEAWDSTAKWDTVYFLLDEAAVKEQK
jgi:hypothetical protein